MNDTEAARCGTYAAYQRHKRRGEKACDPCRAAATQYVREYRQARRPGYVRQLGLADARRRALERLAAQYPKRFRQLLGQERLAEAKRRRSAA